MTAVHEFYDGEVTVLTAGEIDQNYGWGLLLLEKFEVRLAG